MPFIYFQLFYYSKYLFIIFMVFIKSLQISFKEKLLGIFFLFVLFLTILCQYSDVYAYSMLWLSPPSIFCLCLSFLLIFPQFHHSLLICTTFGFTQVNVEPKLSTGAWQHPCGQPAKGSGFCSPWICLTEKRHFTVLFLVHQALHSINTILEICPAPLGRVV